jgi:hypothetical protein
MNMTMENRLLQINTTTSIPVISRVFDTYVLVSVKLQKRGENVPNLFWRLQSSKHMIDVGIRSDTGELTSITVVLYRDLIHSSAPKIVKTESTTEGIPVFSLDCWQIKDPFSNSEYYTIHEGDFSISLEENNLWITLFSEAIESCIGLPGMILCLFGHQRDLCGFVIENLTKEEIDKIRQFEKLWRGIDN